MAFLSRRNNKNIFIAVTFLLLGIFSSSLEFTGAQSIGVCYGGNGYNLPSELEVVDLYKSMGINKMRIYEPNQATLQAALEASLEASLGSVTGLELIVGVRNEDLQNIATDRSAATNWIHQYILPYTPEVDIRYISVGNEVRPIDPAAPFVLPAMQNIQDALDAIAPLEVLQINVTTSIDATLLGSSFPPSAGAFSDSASSHIIPIIQFLADKGVPLLASVYPYFAYAGDTTNIDINYALFTSPAVVVQDGPFGYQNLFDAILDAFYSALEKVGAPNVEVVVSETGWPSDGGIGATIENAGTYYLNLINHVKNSGSPKWPGRPIQTYLYAMFDENLKGPAEIGHHFGLFSPNKLPKYPISFA